MSESEIFYPDLESNIDSLMSKLFRKLLQEKSSPLKTTAELMIACIRADLDASKRLVGENFENKFPGQAIPIARSSLEALQNYLFIAENPFENFNWFRKAAYRDYWLQHQQYLDAYADDPGFGGFFKASTENLKNLEGKVGLNKDEKNSPGKINKWPTPGRMLRERKKFNPYGIEESKYKLMDYLNHWMYGEYSQVAHSQFSGLEVRVRPNRDDLDCIQVHGTEDQDKEAFRRYCSEAIYRPFLFLLMLLSEVCKDFQRWEFFGDAIGVWKKLTFGFLESKEIYDLRYKDLLVF